MTRDDLRATVITALVRVAPEIDPTSIDADAPLRSAHGPTTTTSAPAAHSALRSSNNPVVLFGSNGPAGCTPSSFVNRMRIPVRSVTS